MPTEQLSRPADRTHATLLVRGPLIHTLEPGHAPFRALATYGDRVLARGRSVHDLDDLVGPETVCVDLDEVCLLPGLGDAHMHQIETEQDTGALDLRTARSVAEVVERIRKVADNTSIGSWIVSHRGWHESRLAEKRFPTPAELDAATRDHPVLLGRGSHLAALNSAGLRLASEVAERDTAGEWTGLIRGADGIRSVLGIGAYGTIQTRANSLQETCRLHASRGLVGVREPGISRDDLAVYELLDSRGELTIRTDLLFAVPRTMSRSEKLAFVSELGRPAPPSSSFLRVEGVKLYADGLVENAALREPFEGRPADTGELHLDVDDLVEVAGRAIELGWRVAVHTVGDRALDVLMDATEVLRGRFPGLERGWISVEHAVLADAEQRLRAAALGLGVVVQHPLLDEFALPMLEHWGPRRAAEASPAQGWITAGALVAAGSDGHVPPFDPLRSIWGLTTRQTLDLGVLGVEQAIDMLTALRLYTVGASWLTPWRTPDSGFEPGSFADFVAFPQCVFDAPPDALVNGLVPMLTVAGGTATHDPQGIWPAAELRGRQ